MCAERVHAGVRPTHPPDRWWHTLGPGADLATELTRTSRELIQAARRLVAFHLRSGTGAWIRLAADDDPDGVNRLLADGPEPVR